MGTGGDRHGKNGNSVTAERQPTALVEQVLPATDRRLVHHVDGVRGRRRHVRAHCGGGDAAPVAIAVDWLMADLEGCPLRLPRCHFRCCRRLVGGDGRRQPEAVGPRAVYVAKHLAAVGHGTQCRDVRPVAVAALKRHCREHRREEDETS